jgi:hypothetical protein
MKMGTRGKIIEPRTMFLEASVSRARHTSSRMNYIFEICAPTLAMRVRPSYAVYVTGSFWRSVGSVSGEFGIRHWTWSPRSSQ